MHLNQNMHKKKAAQRGTNIHLYHCTSAYSNTIHSQTLLSSMLLRHKLPDSRENFTPTPKCAPSGLWYNLAAFVILCLFQVMHQEYGVLQLNPDTICNVPEPDEPTICIFRSFEVFRDSGIRSRFCSTQQWPLEGTRILLISTYWLRNKAYAIWRHMKISP